MKFIKYKENKEGLIKEVDKKNREFSLIVGLGLSNC